MSLNAARGTQEPGLRVWIVLLCSKIAKLRRWEIPPSNLGPGSGIQPTPRAKQTNTPSERLTITRVDAEYWAVSRVYVYVYEQYARTVNWLGECGERLQLLEFICLARPSTFQFNRTPKALI
ncbi:hypothetical protein AB1N83_002531 [Pleurotus pulmonarius]